MKANAQAHAEGHGDDGHEDEEGQEDDEGLPLQAAVPRRLVERGRVRRRRVVVVARQVVGGGRRRVRRAQGRAAVMSRDEAWEVASGRRLGAAVGCRRRRRRLVPPLVMVVLVRRKRGQRRLRHRHDLEPAVVDDLQARVVGLDRWCPTIIPAVVI